MHRTASKMSVLFPGPSYHWKLQKTHSHREKHLRQSWRTGKHSGEPENLLTWVFCTSPALYPYTLEEPERCVCLSDYFTQHAQKGCWHGHQSEWGWHTGPHWPCRYIWKGRTPERRNSSAAPWDVSREQDVLRNKNASLKPSQLLSLLLPSYRFKAGQQKTVGSQTFEVGRMGMSVIWKDIFWMIQYTECTEKEPLHPVWQWQQSKQAVWRESDLHRALPRLWQASNLTPISCDCRMKDSLHDCCCFLSF